MRKCRHGRDKNFCCLCRYGPLRVRSESVPDVTQVMDREVQQRLEDAADMRQDD